MDRHRRFAVELSKLRGLPDYLRIPAEERFFTIMEYKKYLQRAEAKPNPPNRADILEKYCFERSTSVSSFYRWRHRYRREGIAGLVSEYGSYDWTVGNTHLEHIKPQSIKPPKKTFRLKIDVDSDAPLKCLPALEKFIVSSPHVSPDVKARVTAKFRLISLLLVDTVCHFDPPLSDEEIQQLNAYVAGRHKKYSKKAAAILMVGEGRSLGEVAVALQLPATTFFRWVRAFREKRLDSIKVTVHAPAREQLMEDRKMRILDIIHKTPALYGINATTWRYEDIVSVYHSQYPDKITRTTVGRVVRGAGYRWKRARHVLMSKDPLYKQKIQRLLDTLNRLTEEDAFFFIDEAGPYRVKKYGGWRMLPEDQIEIVPVFQTPRGKVHLIAALEAQTNQVLWGFTDGRNSAAIIMILDMIFERYSDRRRIFMTWDAVNVHISRQVRERISEINAMRRARLEVVPLPSNAQYLNVIEAVFSGMKRRVIANSDYPTKEDMEAAIAAHFIERNEFYKTNPKRAGNKIWDKEHFDLSKLAGGLFRRM